MADMEDWSLQAIVRGSSGDFTKSIDLDMEYGDNNNSIFFDCGSARQYDHSDQQFDRESLTSFPEVFEMLSGSGDELEELYKQFYPVAAHSLPAPTVLQFEEQNIVGAEDKPAHDHQADQSSETAVTAGYTPKYKRRKNQHKRVVIQVTAEGLSSDMWAWRKYGQKPIKGSPYPRSYYRCSSSKGCLARKQVEQSCNDPGMFIITYTAEHSHSQPTRRNSLAGTVRQKFPSLKTTNSTIHVKQEKLTEELVSSAADIEVVLPHQEIVIKEENNEADTEARAVTGSESCDHDSDFIMSEFVFNEDFFSGLEDFNEFTELPTCQYASAQQFPVRSCT